MRRQLLTPNLGWNLRRLLPTSGWPPNLPDMTIDPADYAISGPLTLLDADRPDLSAEPFPELFDDVRRDGHHCILPPTTPV